MTLCIINKDCKMRTNVKVSRFASVDNGSLGVSFSTIALPNSHYLYIIIRFFQQNRRMWFNMTSPVVKLTNITNIMMSLFSISQWLDGQQQSKLAFIKLPFDTNYPNICERFHPSSHCIICKNISYNQNLALHHTADIPKY